MRAAMPVRSVAGRRRFLRGSLGATALLAGGAWPFPSAWAEPAPAGALFAGPMQGYVAARSAVVWLQTPGAAEVLLDYAPVGEPGAMRRTTPVKTDAASQFCAHIALDDLTPGTQYTCVALVNGRPASDRAITVRTQPLWLFRAPAPDFTVLTGSCAYINDPPFDRPGPAYGGGYEIYDPMIREHADLMVWLGDNLYFREADVLSPEGMALRYRQARGFSPLDAFLRSTPQVAIWDDHDYGPNDGDSSFVFKNAALDLFKTYWANPSYGVGGVAGVFTQVSLFDADFFLLDDRWWRSADATTPGERGKVMFGPAQMRWLRNALLHSRARFKIVAAGGQFFNDDDAYEGWNQFPVERAEFLGWLQQYRIPGVVFLSGDRHITELIKYPRPAYSGKRDYPLIEFTASPLNSHPAP
ncbi:alkaline phosphatase D precursor [mine drainage metagenome]|uniref:Alkaline phosphatase D n=1 Tax=mine drainage metagenome TaxID=410659 RepID=A0A1J5QFA9_9ZZZZ